MKPMPEIARLITLILALLCLPALALAAPAKVAIIPFQINAQKDYEFLKKGIAEMLASRLSQADKVVIIDSASTAQAVEGAKSLSGDSLALKVGNTLEADYTIYGSVTLLGESVSIDAKMLDVTGKRAPLTFFKQTQGMGTVIPQINLLANDINAKVFGRETAAPPGPVVAPAPAAPAQQPVPDIHAHPEKLLQDDQSVAPEKKTETSAANPLNPAFAPAPSDQKATSDFWKSRNFKYLINGIDVGDVNNDGLLETVVITPDELHIYQFAQKRMRLIKTIDTGRFIFNVGVDVGDINGNGTPEIFVSSLNSQRNMLNSQVIEFDGNTYQQIVKKARWYFRIQPQADTGLILLGQRQRTAGADPLSSPVVELEWKGAEYIQSRKVLSPGKTNLLGVAYGDIRNKKTQSLIGFTEDDRLRLFDRKGNELWTSSNYFGGSPVSFLLPQDNPGGLERSFYLPTRSRIVDLDGDQKYEVLVPQNIDSTNRKLAEQRFFKNAIITALAWDGLGMVEVWHTRKISGRVQDLTLADFDNDGQKELLAAIVMKEGAIIGTKSQSTLIAYDLSTDKQK